MNTFVNKTTGKSPYELMFGKKKRLAAVEEILKDIPYPTLSDNTNEVVDRMEAQRKKTIENFKQTNEQTNKGMCE